MKKGIICYYSATGNTRLACEYIKNKLTKVTAELFDMTNDHIPELDNYDFVGLATYTDYGDPPYIVKLFIDKLPPQKNKPAFLFNTCAAMSGKTLKTMKSLTKEKGFRVVAGFTLKAPESYPPARVKGRLFEQNPLPRHMGEFNKFIAELNYRLSSDGQNLTEAKLKIGLINTLIPKFARDKSKIVMGNKFVDRLLCTKCGLCKSICPYKAIDLVEVPSFDESKCYGCWTCFNHCPQKAIYTDKIKGQGHYGQPELYKKKLK